MTRSVAVTGVGIMTCFGCGPAAVWANLNAAARSSGSGGSPLISSPRFQPVSDAVLAECLPVGQVRRMDRLSRLVTVVLRLALADSGGLLNWSPEAVGSVMNTCFGSRQTAWSAMEALVRRGPRGMSASLFAQSSYNAPLGNALIYCGLKGVSTVFCDSSAIGYALGAIEDNRCEAICVLGAEEWPDQQLEMLVSSEQTTAGGGAVAGWSEKPEWVPGEAAACLVLEPLAAALARGARIYAELASSVTVYGGPETRMVRTLSPQALIQTMSRSLGHAGVAIDQVDWVFSCANGSSDLDQAEVVALRELSERRASTFFVSRVKSVVGETLGASEVLSVALASWGLHSGYMARTSLVNSVTWSGLVSSSVLTRHPSG